MPLLQSTFAQGTGKGARLRVNRIWLALSVGTYRLQAVWEKVLRRTRISKFRWHDLRHHFASRLVQQGVPLNTVRDLLGHGSVGMSLRYAHLAPDQRREAVAKLNEKLLLTLTMRLQWEGLPVASGYRVDSIVVREGQELASQIPLSGNLPVLELRL
jgi:hypothetical protein